MAGVVTPVLILDHSKAISRKRYSCGRKNQLRRLKLFMHGALQLFYADIVHEFSKITQNKGHYAVPKSNYLELP